MRNTAVVWYGWLPGVTTTKSCATAAAAPRIRNVVHSGVCSVSLETNGVVTAAAAATTTQK